MEDKTIYVKMMYKLTKIAFLMYYGNRMYLLNIYSKHSYFSGIVETFYIQWPDPVTLGLSVTTI